jgi:aryl-alcohol dehydrogenase-like predicted oxidoreductase
MLAPMEQRTLGRTGLLVSRIGLGLAALGRPGYVNVGHGSDLRDGRDVASMERRAHQVLDAARAGGVTYFDAARSYGRAEEFLGSWLAARHIAPGELSIGTKWGYTYTAGWRVDAEVHEVKDHSLATLRRQWDETRAALDGHVALLQVHSATVESGILDDRAVHRALAELRERGDIRAIGLSLSGARQAETLRRAHELEVDGRPLFDAVQATWNVLEPSVGERLAEVRADGMGVIVKEALANGRLVRGAEAASVASEAERLGTTADALALAAVLAQPWADVVLSGAVSVEQLATNLASASVRLDDEAWSAFDALRQEPEAYWRERAALPWT